LAWSDCIKRRRSVQSFFVLCPDATPLHSRNKTLYIRASDQTALISARVASYSSDNNLDVADGVQDVDLLVSGRIVGDWGWRKRGAGTAEFTNTGNNYGGTTAIEAGTLLVNNTSGVGTGNSAVLINGGTLGGIGSVATSLGFGANGGVVTPGSPTGTLTANCNVDFTSAGPTVLRVTVNGGGAGEYSRLAVNGTVTLANAALAVQLNNRIAVGKKLFLLVNDGTDAIAGTFSALPNGANIRIENGALSQSFTIYYTADSLSGAVAGGNDVALVPVEDGTLIRLR